jgi:hypothetical protein
MLDGANSAERSFDAVVFVERINLGALDGQFTESIVGLSDEQLDQVAALMAKQLKEKRGTLRPTEP